MRKIKGHFILKTTPLKSSDKETPLGLIKMLYEKEFFGDITGKSLLSMSGILDMKTMSGGYVAIEKFEGEIEGKKGSFYLQHSTYVEDSEQNQTIKVIPHSGTEELIGLIGEMKIEIKSGKHHYSFHYELVTNPYLYCQ